MGALKTANRNAVIDFNDFQNLLGQCLAGFFVFKCQQSRPATPVQVLLEKVQIFLGFFAIVIMLTTIFVCIHPKFY